MNHGRITSKHGHIAMIHGEITMQHGRIAMIYGDVTLKLGRVTLLHGDTPKYSILAEKAYFVWIMTCVMEDGGFFLG